MNSENAKENEIKSILFSKKPADNEMGLIKLMDQDELLPTTRAGTRKEFILSQKFGFPYSADNIKFLSDNDDSLVIDDIVNLGLEQSKRHKLQEQLKRSHESQYDEPGVISFNSRNEKINISVTQRELIEAKLNPEMLKWKSLEQAKEEEPKLSAKDFARATKSRVSKSLMESVGKMFDKIRGKEDEGR